MARLLFFAMLLLIISCKNKPQETDNTPPPPTFCAPRAYDALAEPVDALPLFDGLGQEQFSITTKAEKAQTYFTQGYRLTVAFNHMEAVRSFRYAIQQDSSCAMCYWGLAYALGPNYNAAFDTTVLAIANSALGKAQQYMAQTTPKEQALIKALVKRYPTKTGEDQTKYESAYAKALQDVHAQFPDDGNISALYAEALMNLHPWDLWQSDGRPKPWTPQILQLLESILARDSSSIAAIHLYIHATEAASPAPLQSISPSKALKYAVRLPALAPGAGHLVHMPSHTYIRTGDYHQGVLSNEAAVAVDSQYVAACHAAGSYPLAYYPHNFHFLAACAALEGSSKKAIDASWRMVQKLDTMMMRKVGYETIQHYYSIPYYVMVKFARWDDILKLPRPAKDLAYPTAIWRYARGMALAAQGKIKEAQVELADLQLLQRDKKIREFTIWDINKVGDLLDIAALVLEGEIALKRNDPKGTEKLLQKAVQIEDQLHYNEPPDWFFSTRHYLGPVLLQEGKYAEAEQLYRRDLELFPRNGYAFKGLEDALRKQNKNAAASLVRQSFEASWKYADVKLTGSLVTE